MGNDFAAFVTYDISREGGSVNKLMAVTLIAGLWALNAATAHARTSPSESTTHVISDQDMNLLRKTFVRNENN